MYMHIVYHGSRRQHTDCLELLIEEYAERYINFSWRIFRFDIAKVMAIDLLATLAAWT